MASGRVAEEFFRLAAPLLVLTAALALTAPARAESLRVTGRADAGAHARQARSQALDRAFVAAVMQESVRLAPGPPAPARLNALRQYLAPHVSEFVESYRMAAAAPEQEAGGAAASAESASGLALTFDVSVDVRALRSALTRLGFFAPRPLSYAASLGPGVSAREARSLGASSLLLGLTRTDGAAVQATLERGAGGYTVVLRRGVEAFTAEGARLSDAWLAAWGRLFTSLAARPNDGSDLFARGFAGVDGVEEFSRALSSWSDAVQGAALSSVEIEPGDIAARWAVRVASPALLAAHLRKYLPGRGISVETGGRTFSAAGASGRRNQ